MTRASMVAVVLALSAVHGIATAQPDDGRTSAPAVRTSVDRTAMWVGDRVTYTVEFTLPRGIDVLEDDLAQDRVKLDGLDFVSREASRTEHADGGGTRQFRYVLASYKVNQPSVRVAPFTVRYYVTRPGQRLQESAPAGEVPVPGAIVALRSTLPEEQETLALRDGRPAAPRPAIYALAQPVGIALIVVAIAPAAFAAIAFAARRRAARATRSGRQVRRQERASLEAARSLDAATPAGRRDIYTHIDAIVRDHVEYAGEIPGRSLTPGEIGAGLAARGSRLPAESVVALLEECERARYAPAAQLPPAEACREALDLAGQIVSIRR